MSRLNKILASLFVIFLIVVVVEILIPIISSKHGTTPATNTLSPTNTQLNKTLDNPGNTTAEKQKASQDQALSNNTVKYLQLLRKGILTSSILVNTYIGTIKSLDTKGGVVDKTRFGVPFVYKESLTLHGPGDLTNIFFFFEGDTPNIQITDSTVNPAEPIQFSGLKPGDHLKMTDTLNLVEPINQARVKTTIEKIQ